jgi:7-keto-8-aminopelargonate synthetase-like enzyme
LGPGTTVFHVFRYNAIVFVDECHATGFFGQSGRGTEEFFQMVKRVVKFVVKCMVNL